VGTTGQFQEVREGSETAVSGISSPAIHQAPAKALPASVAAFDAALGRMGVQIVKVVARRRRSERGLSAEMFAFLTSYGWADALRSDEAVGLSMADAWQILVGIKAYCPTHLIPFDGEDVNGLFCADCERGVPARTSQALRVDCDPCGGSCEGRCDAGAGTWPERQARELAEAVR
jgi:hypothetical protein